MGYVVLIGGGKAGILGCVWGLLGMINARRIALGEIDGGVMLCAIRVIILFVMRGSAVSKDVSRDGSCEVVGVSIASSILDWGVSG